MIKLLFDFIQFLNTLAPLFVALGVLTLLTVLLSKSIKKYAVIYYIAFALPFIPYFLRLFGIEIFSFSRIPFLGGITRDYVHAGTLGFHLLVIIMYMGALDTKISWVKKLMSIRKELSIISGFPILTHAIIRFNQGLNGLRFFTDNEAYMASGRVTSALGTGLSSFSFVLGILMLALFIPLWVTSFDFVHKRMGGTAWKKLQRWSYVLYAMLFIHAMGIQTGGMLNPRGGREQSGQHAVEVTATIANTSGSLIAENQDLQQATGRSGRGGRGRGGAVQPADSANIESAKPAGRTERGDHRGGRGDRNVMQPANSSGEHTEAEGHANSSNRVETATAEHEHGVGNTVQPAGSGNSAETARPARSGRQQTTGFADITVSSQARRYIHIASLLLIFGSYLYLRLRKAKMNRAKRLSLTTGK